MDDEKSPDSMDGASSSGATVDDGREKTVLSPSADEKGRETSPVATAAPPPQPAGPGDPETQRTSLQTFVIMAGLCSSVFLAALDITIITTALPVMSEELKGDSASYTWIGGAYLLANAASTPSWGKLSDIWGRKPILLAAAAIFFVGSAISGASRSIAMLVAARAVQGIGGGGLIILANICISDLFPLRSRGKYFGMIGMVWATASAVGPILGGVFTEKVSWRWCFYVNCKLARLRSLSSLRVARRPR